MVRFVRRPRMDLERTQSMFPQLVTHNSVPTAALRLSQMLVDLVAIR
jgi:hypothetical protein